jgi:hypothetical protein
MRNFHRAPSLLALNGFEDLIVAPAAPLLYRPGSKHAIGSIMKVWRRAMPVSSTFVALVRIEREIVDLLADSNHDGFPLGSSSTLGRWLRSRGIDK